MSSISKEDAKNMALLFFMDHLMQKNGRRTIHDLSCQFGARGFSQEMREAVGATQEGLTDFLSQFPSLFVLEGDTVTMTGYGDLAAGGAKASPLLQTLSRDRDYEMEAVEFFVEKLHRFGPELQIKSLLGHRSQSAPEIRLVSGRHVKEFADFLASHPEHFVIGQDRVRLRDMPEPTDTDHTGDVDELGSPLVGARAKQLALDFLRETVEEACGFGKENAQSTPLPVDALYRKFCSRFSHQIRQEVATNPKELLQFLKLNRHIFFIRSNKVSIVRNRGNGQNGDSAGNESPKTDDGSTSDASSDVRPLLRLAATTERGEEEAVGRHGRPQLVKSLLGAQLALAELEQEGDAVGLDAKLVTLGERRFVSLLALASQRGARLFAFDVAHSQSILLESGLKEMLEADHFVKVVHDSANLATLLRQQFQIQIRNVFDTQIGNAVIQHQRSNKPMGEVKTTSFLSLQRIYHPQSLMCSDRSITTPKNTVQNWSVRPLTDEMIDESVDQVRYLMPFMYKSMKAAIMPSARDLFMTMCDIAVGLPAAPPPMNGFNNRGERLKQQPNRRLLNRQEMYSINHRPENFVDSNNQMKPPTAQNCTCNCHHFAGLNNNNNSFSVQNNNFNGMFQNQPVIKPKMRDVAVQAPAVLPCIEDIPLDKLWMENIKVARK